MTARELLGRRVSRRRLFTFGAARATVAATDALPAACPARPPAPAPPPVARCGACGGVHDTAFVFAPTGVRAVRLTGAACPVAMQQQTLTRTLRRRADTPAGH